MPLAWARWTALAPIWPPWVMVMPPSVATAWMPSLRPAPSIVPVVAVVIAIAPVPVDLAWTPSLTTAPALTVIGPVMPPLFWPMLIAPSTLSAWMPSPLITLIAAVESMLTVLAPAPAMKSARPSMPSPVVVVIEPLEAMVIEPAPPSVRPTMPSPP